MNNEIKLTLIILLITINSSFGQSDFRNGFIITNEKDTIRGLVDYRSNSKNYRSCVFKGKQGVTEYSPNQILGCGYVSDKFFSSQIQNGSFVEVLVAGEISLYKSKEKYHVKKDTTLIDLESITEKVEINGKIGTMENNRWRGILSYFTGDCLDNSFNVVSNLEFNEKSLTRLIIKYNKCRSLAYTEFKASKPWTKFDFGATIGISRSEIQTTDETASFYYLDDSYSSINPSVGVLISISSPRITEKIAFQGEIHFIKSSFSSLVELNGLFPEFHDTFIDLSTLSIPLSLKYSFSEKNSGLYLQGGINYEYHLSSNTSLLSERVTGSVVNTSSESLAFEINDNQIGYWGGIGIFKSYRKLKGSVAIRYFQMSALSKTDGFVANNNRISINLILFKK